MNKQVEYKGFKININVHLGGSPVKRGDTPEHLVVVSDRGSSNYYRKYVITGKEDLTDKVVAIEEKTYEDFDLLIGKPNHKEEYILEQLGYS